MGHCRAPGKWYRLQLQLHSHRNSFWRISLRRVTAIELCSCETEIKSCFWHTGFQRAATLTLQTLSNVHQDPNFVCHGLFDASDHTNQWKVSTTCSWLFYQDKRHCEISLKAARFSFLNGLHFQVQCGVRVHRWFKQSSAPLSAEFLAFLGRYFYPNDVSTFVVLKSAATWRHGKYFDVKSTVLRV